MMLQTSAGFLAGIAVTLSLSVPMGSGDRVLRQDTAQGTAAAVHRAVKSDLGAVVFPHTSSRTVSFRLESLPSMSVVFRIPGNSGQGAGDRVTTRENRDLNRAPPPRRAKRAIACEPVVSTLTDVAKRLEPGRCVT